MLTPELLSAFILFAFVAAITPGPNNTMVLTSGVNFGVMRTVPHILGIAFGFAFMVIAIGCGLGEVFKEFPVLYTVIRFAGAAYLLYLAWKIAGSRSIGKSNSSHSKPIGLFSAMAFQWVNPKSWMMAISAVSAYTTRTHYFSNVFDIAIIFLVVVIPCCYLWTVFGSKLRQYLTNAKRLRIFNISMAILLVASLYPLIKS